MLLGQRRPKKGRAAVFEWFSYTGGGTAPAKFQHKGNRYAVKLLAGRIRFNADAAFTAKYTASNPVSRWLDDLQMGWFVCRN